MATPKKKHKKPKNKVLASQGLFVYVQQTRIFTKKKYLNQTTKGTGTKSLKKHASCGTILNRQGTLLPWDCHCYNLRLKKIKLLVTYHVLLLKNLTKPCVFAKQSLG